MGLALELLTNDLSIHGQFHDIPTFRIALKQLMAIRNVAKRYGREVYCHRNMASVQVMPNVYMQQAIQGLPIDDRRAVMQWLTRHGPFWEDERLHGKDDWLECRGDVVTDTAVGETAYRCFNQTKTSLVSLIPSLWDFSPALVEWHKSDEELERTEVVNYWDADTLETALLAAPLQITSWEMLENMSTARCTQLTFSSDCFNPLKGYPIVPKTIQDILNRLEVLNQFKICFDTEGKRTNEGHRLYQKHFTGKRAWFSDSSDTKKDKFKQKLTFSHPSRIGESLFCPWHGKVNFHPPLRIHFSWPVTAVDPLYIVYVGPKLTLR